MADGDKPVLEKNSSSKENSSTISGDRRKCSIRSSIITLYLLTSSLGGEHLIGHDMHGLAISLNDLAQIIWVR
jgi:hypothetical protein